MTDRGATFFAHGDTDAYIRQFSVALNQLVTQTVAVVSAAERLAGICLSRSATDGLSSRIWHTEYKSIMEMIGDAKKIIDGLTIEYDGWRRGDGRCMPKNTVETDFLNELFIIHTLVYNTALREKINHDINISKCKFANSDLVVINNFVF